METLGKLFGSQARVKVLRLFLFNPEYIFEAQDVRHKSQLTQAVVTKELACLSSVGVIKHKTGTKLIYKKIHGGEISTRKKKIRGWVLNDRFFYLDTLRPLLTNKKSFERDVILKKIQGVGRIKLLIISGIFIQNDDSRIDLFIVVDRLRRSVMARALKGIESETGKELRYGIFTTKEFLYRLDVYDKFVRDVLDCPHEKLVDKIGLK